MALSYGCFRAPNPSGDCWHTHLRKVVAKNPLPGLSTRCTSDSESSSLLQQCRAAPAWTPSRDSVFNGSRLTSHLRNGLHVGGPRIRDKPFVQATPNCTCYGAVGPCVHVECTVVVWHRTAGRTATRIKKPTSSSIWDIFCDCMQYA